jgi:hypothetical protein
MASISHSIFSLCDLCARLVPLRNIDILTAQNSFWRVFELKRRSG